MDTSNTNSYYSKEDLDKKTDNYCKYNISKDSTNFCYRPVSELESFCRIHLGSVNISKDKENKKDLSKNEHVDIQYSISKAEIRNAWSGISLTSFGKVYNDFADSGFNKYYSKFIKRYFYYPSKRQFIDILKHLEKFPKILDRNSDFKESVKKSLLQLLCHWEPAKKYLDLFFLDPDWKNEVDKSNGSILKTSKYYNKK